MPKPNPKLDVLILGDHPCAYLSAALLVTGKPRVEVIHATIPGPIAPDRLVIVNPAFFGLHKPLEKLRKKLNLRGVNGVAFLGSDGSTRGEWRAKSAVACIGDFEEIRRSLADLASESGVRSLTPKSLKVQSADQSGFEVQVDGSTIRPKAILLAGDVAADIARPLALPEPFGIETMRRYTFLRLKEDSRAGADPKPLVQMSLDVDGKLTWAWMLAGPGAVQLAVEQPLESVQSTPPGQLMEKWVATLRGHGVIDGTAAIRVDRLESLDFPAAGALGREIVANRTLLFGPSGGFYSASLEDIYPNCWSAVFAVNAIRSALPEPHLQDALQAYRQSWGSTLGEYLQGPQQNLRFLLPLVYRNPVMTARMGEAILLGKSVVR